MDLAHIGFLYKDINTGLKNWKSDKTKILIKKTKDKRIERDVRRMDSCVYES